MQMKKTIKKTVRMELIHFITRLLVFFALYSGILFPLDGIGDNKEGMNNTQKIKFINQAIRNALQQKKMNIRPEDVFPVVSTKMTLDELTSYRNADESLQKYYEQLEKKLQKEARSKYPVFLMGDNLVASGNSERVSGIYNKKNSRGIWLGMRLIPWADMKPECAAQFKYEDAVRLRTNYVKKHFGNIEVDGKLTTARQYIIDKVTFAKDLMNKEVPKGDWIRGAIILLGCVIGWLLFALIGKNLKKQVFTYGLIGCVIGGGIAWPAGHLLAEVIRNQNLEKVIETISESLIDPEEKDQKNYRFNKIEERQTAFPRVI